MKNLLSLLFFALFLPTLASAADDAAVKEILELPKAPDGVVFEIVSSDADFLRRAIPKAKQHIAALRQRFPGISIAVVTHGDEQFALTAKNRAEYSEVHEQIVSLRKDDDVPLHVCGAYASWKNVSPEEFPDYVDVSATGPAEIRQYQDFGYHKVVISD
jgi:intracellular sulfur oxidation DsrE/DsrF family protein